MTIAVIVKVPAGTDYKAVVQTKTTGGETRDIDVMPGDEFHTYVYPGREVSSIREVPLESA